MKIRNGFVSNSSSSSFVVSLNKISERDLKLLLSYTTLPDSDYWSISVDEQRGFVRGFTIMDNSDLSDYMREKEIDCSLFEWDYD